MFKKRKISIAQLEIIITNNRQTGYENITLIIE